MCIPPYLFTKETKVKFYFASAELPCFIRTIFIVQPILVWHLFFYHNLPSLTLLASGYAYVDFFTFDFPDQLILGCRDHLLRQFWFDHSPFTVRASIFSLLHP
ncbi:hypothetical protein MtrunA17_Chr3g0131461 [Medicago truncatula]|uniref:Uncharacterized protein n=1 Tax=Medicago truncatula TaxID=3880 RepID=A0A396IZI0_MEDTR|nr:hypothetical protein MtrunA17_Chr3g0131461 [Medicago truncatula]